MEVIDRLGLNALEAFKAVPRRGLEIGGILLGRTEVHDGFTTVYIQEFETVQSEHRSGPSYLLSESDLERLDGALRKHPDVVGMYRTHTRPETMQLEEDDKRLFERYFNSPDRVFLLVQPMTAKAAVFVNEGGKAVAVHEFLFRRSELVEYSDPVEPAAAPVAVTVPLIPTAAKVAKVEKLANLAKVSTVEMLAKFAKLEQVRRPPWLMTAVAVILGFAAGAAVVGMRREVAAPASPVVAASVAPVAEHVALHVEREGRAIRLEWDRNARAIRQAGHGIVYVTDGSRQIHLDLAQPELDSGFVSYWPETSAVTFRLETYAADHSTSDTVRVVGAITATPEAQPVNPARAQRAEPVGSRRAKLQPAPASHVEEADVKPSPMPVSRSEMVAPSPPESNRAVVPDPAPAVEPVAAAPEPAPHTTRGRDPHVSVVAEPVTGSRFGRVVGKIPLLRRLRKPTDTFVPPSPTHEVRPELNAENRRSLRRAVPVDVKVYVAESGKVRYAELLSDGTGERRELASAAIYAARRWDFVPARLGDENVPGEVILHFKFTPIE